MGSICIYLPLPLCLYRKFSLNNQYILEIIKRLLPLFFLQPPLTKDQSNMKLYFSSNIRDGTINVLIYYTVKILIYVHEKRQLIYYLDIIIKCK